VGRGVVAAVAAVSAGSAPAAHEVRIKVMVIRKIAAAAAVFLVLFRPVTCRFWQIDDLGVSPGAPRAAPQRSQLASRSSRNSVAPSGNSGRLPSRTSAIGTHRTGLPSSSTCSSASRGTASSSIERTA